MRRTQKTEWWSTKNRSAYSSQLRAKLPREFETLETRRLLAADLKALAFAANQANEVGPQAIVGGQATDRGSFDWVVSLQNGAGHFCGGTLIAQDAVVTAAHCVEGSSNSDFDAVVGRSDLGRTDDGQRVGISQIIVHPDYDAINTDSDIAILLLSDFVNETPIGYLTPASAELANPGVNATALGWGTTREGGSSVTNLRSVVLPIVSTEVANRPISYGGDITPHMLAAGDAQGGIDSCQGDSGGPLVVTDASNQPQLAGIVSWGEGCGRPNKYGIYTRVTEFSDWLDGFVGIEPAGQVDFNQERYVSGNEIQVVVRDSNVGDESVNVVVTSEAGDRETLTLAEFSSGRFRASLNLTDADVVQNDGMLSVEGDSRIEVEYLDDDDGEGQSRNVQAESLVVEDDFGNSFEEAFLITQEQITSDDVVGEGIAGEVEVTGDVDWFEFEGVAGTGYVIGVELDGSLNDSIVTIYDGDGDTVLGFNDDSGRGLSSELIYFPTENGTIFIAAGGFGANIGTYTLVLEETDSLNDDHSDIFGGATQVAIGGRTPGRIDIDGDTDWFSFEAEAGHVYEIEVNLRTLEDSELRLVDSDGRTELAFNDDYSFFTTASRIYHRVEESRTLSFEVAGYQTSTGTYNVQVTELDDDHGNDPTDATVLGTLSTSTITRSGDIRPQDVDWFSFDANENDYFQFSTETITLSDSVLRVYDAAGEQVLATNDDHESQFASQLVWQAPADGRFFVEVSGFDNLEGTFELNARRLSTRPIDDFGNRAALAGDANIGETVSGNVNYEADFDWLSFESVAGAEYTFEIELASLEDSFLQIFDADGTTLLAENDDIEYPDLSSRIEWTAETTGTKYVVVSAFDGFLGTYQLSSTVVEPVLIGDFNDDATVDATDIDLLFAVIAAGAGDEQFDINQDGSVNSLDSDALISDVLNVSAGDTNLDGQIDFADFLALSRNFGGSGGWADGDFNGDQAVNFADFTVMARNFGRA